MTLATSVVAGLVSAAPAAVAEEDTGLYRNSIGEQARLDRCTAGVALHIGGPQMKAKAVEGLTGSDGQLATVIGTPENLWGQMRDAQVTDKQAVSDYLERSRKRKADLEAANKVYAQSGDNKDITLFAPEFDKDVTAYTLGAYTDLLGRLGEDGHAAPTKSVVDRATALAEANKGKDSWNDQAAAEMIGDAGESTYRATTASDLAYYLAHGGYPDTTPEAGTAEYRVEVEALKGAWSACDSLNPVDARRVMNPVVLTAAAEWDAEYKAQATPRGVIIKAEADAAKATRDATDAMIETIGLAWRAEQILLWQKYWAGRPADDILRPAKSVFTKAAADLATLKASSASAAVKAKTAADSATTASGKAVSAQADAYKIADVRSEPRGRGLLYAQQSVQVSRASAAAATAAAAAAQTAADAAKATAADTATLLKLAQTRAHAVNTAFRRTAAEEAAKQAKAAADSAVSYANKAAGNATTAKNAQATAAAQKEIARKEAENAAAKATTAEQERANAAAYAKTAATERGKADIAEKKAQSLKSTATTARGDADSAADTASGKREAAEDAEAAAEYARDKAYQAEQNKKAYEARAAALESAVAAAEGTAAAGEARQAATEARAAANTAGTAAAGARQAAADATTAAVNARAAATNAQASASKSRKAADDAWSSYWGAASAATTAHAAAATAIDASEQAAANAKKAGEEAAKAKEQAKIAQDNARVAHSEATLTAQSAAETAGQAFATTQAALAARDSADKAVKAAHSAISIGSPYQENDSAAAFAVLSGQQALTFAEQQAKAAKAKSDEAQRMAKEAQVLADKASADDKAAAQAAAAAAVDASRAATAYANAKASAREAKAAATAAQQLADEASGYAVQAGSSAVSAGLSANSAESEAAAADRDATEAEKDASSARQAASDATDEADAADFSARAAETDASAAETSAGNAHQAADDAQKAATRAEEEERKRVAEERRKALESGDTGVIGGVGAPLTADERALLLKTCGQSCVDDWDEANAAVTASVIDWIKANGAEVLLELIGVNDAKRCFTQGDVESCLWTAVNVGSLAVIVGKIGPVAKAIATVVARVGSFFEKAEWGKRTLDHLRKVVEAAKKIPDSVGKSTTPCTHPKASECKNITFPYKEVDGTYKDGRVGLGSDGKYHFDEGASRKDIYDVKNDPHFINRITDIDLIKDGVLWEEKTAVYAMDLAEQKKWVAKHLPKKIESYLKARPLIKGYEGAPIGFKFTKQTLVNNPGLKALVEQSLKELRVRYGADIRVWWP